MSNSKRDLDFEPAGEFATIITDLHASEINGEIGWFFDGVWRAKIGDPWNGYKAEVDGLMSLAEAADWLRSKAIELYPNSEFAKAHRRGFE